MLNKQIQFDESAPLYSDIPFLMKIYQDAFSILETSICLYYKLIHNDPINYASLSQEDHDHRFEELFRTLSKSIEQCDDLALVKQVKVEAISQYLYKVVKSPIFKVGTERLTPIYQYFQTILNAESNPFKLKRRHTKEIDAIKNGNYNKAYRLSKKRVLYYTLYQSIKPKKKRARQRTVQQMFFLDYLSNTTQLFMKAF